MQRTTPLNLTLTKTYKIAILFPPLRKPSSDSTSEETPSHQTWQNP